jgi:2-oxoglutarate dehydrogenase E2 component (dihydrolipoamide succinyltransferase)
MAIVDLVMPKLGESITEATILKWHKQPGDQIANDENILDIATDKVDTEVPSSVEGVLEEQLYQVNDVVSVGAVIARIRVSVPENSSHPQPSASPAGSQRKQEYANTGSNFIRTTAPAESQPNGNRFFSPLVLNIAANEGISMQELETIRGTGHEGRVSKRDMLQYVSDRKGGGQVNQPSGTKSPAPAYAEVEVIADNTPPGNGHAGFTPQLYSGNTEIVEMDRMRRLIARHMVDSVHTSAHVTSFAEADVTNMVLWRERVKKEFEKRENEKITFTPLFIEAIIKCIKKYPWLNSSIDGDKLIVKKDINIGMATALPGGNLIVPVIKNADQLNLVGLTRQVNALANSARLNKLRPDDTSSGTFTLTNIGSFGSIMGTPIINQPQVAILAAGAIKKRPVVIETAQGDAIAVRQTMYLSLSYDHRIIDGALGSTFLNAIAKELENFNPEREF